MGLFSRNKGKRGEREWASMCRDHGYNAKRTAQNCGKTGDAGDVEGLPGLHQEVKRVEHLNLRDAMEQSIHDAEAEGKGMLPIVAHKKNRLGWLVTMRAEDWFELYREWEAGMDLKARGDHEAGEGGPTA